MTGATKNKGIDIARYFLMRSAEDGDLITNLKMQKLVYFAYVHTLASTGNPLTEEKFQAWPNGPVLPSLYKILSRYGSSPIGAEFANIKSDEDLESIKSSFEEAEWKIINKVYEKYIVKSAFELVAMTHNAAPWRKAREGLEPTERSNNVISDKDIVEQYVH